MIFSRSPLSKRQTEAAFAVRMVIGRFKPQYCREGLYNDWNVGKPMEMSASLQIIADIIVLVLFTI